MNELNYTSNVIKSSVSKTTGNDVQDVVAEKSKPNKIK